MVIDKQSMQIEHQTNTMWTNLVDELEGNYGDILPLLQKGVRLSDKLREEGERHLSLLVSCGLGKLVRDLEDRNEARKEAGNE